MLAQGSKGPSPLGAVVRGLGAGVAGTAAMTVSQTVFAKLRASEPSTTPATIAPHALAKTANGALP